MKSLGFKDHSLVGNGFDASNEDGGINIQPHPVLGMYQLGLLGGIAVFVGIKRKQAT